MAAQKRIMCVGLVCLDMKTVVAEYPQEDTCQRTLCTIMTRGGNASNTSSVLALLGCKVEYFGTVSDCENKRFITGDFGGYGVNIDNIVVCLNSKCPISIVIVNSKNGSRTILHDNSNLRELKLEDFKLIDLNLYKWIHFEGRPNYKEISLMIQHILDFNKTVTDDNRIVISLECENINRMELENLSSVVDYTFFSKQFAQHLGYDNMVSLISKKATEKGKTVICAWGEMGAAAKSPQEPLVTSQAFTPTKMVDSTGAGDTFNAACIFSLSQGYSLQESIENGCRVAGAKCGMVGLKGISQLMDLTRDLL